MTRRPMQPRTGRIAHSPWRPARTSPEQSLFIRMPPSVAVIWSRGKKSPTRPLPTAVFLSTRPTVTSRSMVKNWLPRTRLVSIFMRPWSLRPKDALISFWLMSHQARGIGIKSWDIERVGKIAGLTAESVAYISKRMKMKSIVSVINQLNWGMVILVCATLGLAPFSPPHIIEKLSMLIQGNLIKPLDWFDLLFHGLPWFVLIVKIMTFFSSKKKHLKIWLKWSDSVEYVIIWLIRCFVHGFQTSRSHIIIPF